MSSLLTLSKTQLESLGAKDFQMSLDKMTLDAIKRFKSTRTLPDQFNQIIDSQIAKLNAEAARARKSAAKTTGGASGKSEGKKGAKPSKSGADDGYIPFPERFKAWWNGTSASAESRKDRPSRAAKKKDPVARRREITQSSPQAPTEEWIRRIRDRVWGEGFTLPGGGNVILNMAKISQMQAEDVAADILPGGIGPAKALMGRYPNMVTCFEVEPLEAKRLEDESEGVVRGQVFNYQNPDFGIRAFDRMFCRENMCFVPNREMFLRNAAGALRGGGRFVFNDIVLFPRDDEHEDVTEWRKAEPEKPVLWSVEEYQDKLGKCRLDLKNTANITKSYVAMVESEWRKVATTLASDPLPPEGVDALMAEGQLWQTRIAALKSGQVGIVRFSTVLKTIRQLSGP
ncbi:methyltransferase domain-containing protein [Pyruvatibacter mobilis]|uniref:methyltransferase domain-containing protein n=1 Tax=Pyruvatibacter mobilis TaxID=1712261 RepID=UPI003BB1F3EC